MPWRHMPAGMAYTAINLHDVRLVVLILNSHWVPVQISHSVHPNVLGSGGTPLRALITVVSYRAFN
jgi:hypothetical protein